MAVKFLSRLSSFSLMSWREWCSTAFAARHNHFLSPLNRPLSCPPNEKRERICFWIRCRRCYQQISRFCAVLSLHSQPQFPHSAATFSRIAIEGTLLPCIIRACLFKRRLSLHSLCRVHLSSLTDQCWCFLPAQQSDYKFQS